MQRPSLHSRPQPWLPSFSLPRLGQGALLLAFLSACSAVPPHRPDPEIVVTVSDTPTQRHLRIRDPQRRMELLGARLSVLNTLIAQERRALELILRRAFEATEPGREGWGIEEWTDHEAMRDQLHRSLESLTQEHNMATQGRDAAQQEIRRQEAERRRQEEEREERRRFEETLDEV